MSIVVGSGLQSSSTLSPLVAGGSGVELEVGGSACSSGEGPGTDDP